MNKKTNNWFKYVVIAAVLLIPFMYSFFYLKAYWNPYGKGNIDNLPVAVVNSDKGDKGNELINSIKDSKKLKLSVVESSKANEGLNNGKYYAIINIPEDFTSDMESASSKNKRHATITYSPNQKTNYLSSQIINTVVLTVEKNLDNAVNSEIVKSLSETVEKVPSQLDTISDGFGQLEDGTNKLADGSNSLNTGTKSLADGTESLNNNYSKFNEGIENIKSGTDQLKKASDQFSELNSGINELTTGVSTLKSGTDGINSGINNYVDSVNSLLSMASSNPAIITTPILTLKQASCTPGSPAYDANNCAYFTKLINDYKITDASYTLTSLISDSGKKLKLGSSELKSGVDTLSTKVSKLSTVPNQLTALQNGINTLNNGANTLYDSSLKIKSGIENLNTGALKLNSGSTTLNDGLITLNNSVKSSKKELDSKISSTKKDVKKVETLADYSKEPIKAKTKEVNKVSSYGTAFAPLFISIALWVGSLMLFIVLFFDKEKRFGILGIDSKERLKRTFAYHGLASLSGIVLGVLLQLLLDFDITNVFLYYVSIILVSNCFLAIIEFLIENFGDIGKFIALIILVLQLGASGGTFPIETVTKGFRFLNPILPMTYTIKLLKEPLINIESSLLAKNFIIVFIIFIVFFGANIGINLYKEKHQK